MKCFQEQLEEQIWFATMIPTTYTPSYSNACLTVLQGCCIPPAHSAKCMGSPDIDILNFLFFNLFFILNERHMLVIMHIIYFELLKCMKVYTAPPHTNASTQCCAFLMADSVRLNCKIEQEVATTCDAKQSSALGRALKWDAWVPTFKTISYSTQLFFIFFFTFVCTFLHVIVQTRLCFKNQKSKKS